MSSGYVQSLKWHEPVIGEGHQVHGTTGINEHELQRATGVAPARTGFDVVHVGGAKVAAGHQEIRIGGNRRILADAVSAEEINLWNIAAAGWITVRTVAEVRTPHVSVFPARDIMEPRGVVPELKISRFRYTQREVGPATGGRGIVVDSSSGIAELGRQRQRRKNDRESDEKRSSSHRLPPGKG